jgi:uroporphyrin-III C-methyltransferase/precorrin-2 dehydrogenase/sirohydrochlorin ferrochelatase
MVGKVILAGAGPGDAELITLKLQRFLQQADVIISDRLVNPAIIEMHAKQDVLVVMAGKQGYNNGSFSQEEINGLIVKYALEGKLVLRLKGGDVALFSNMLDELYALEKYSIPYEIIPGITAAAGASAYSGIPLTGRGFAQGVQFLTFNPKSFHSAELWKLLATTSDTLVFYMSIKNETKLAELLLQYTPKPEMPMALIEQATTKYQQVYTTTLKKCAADFAAKNFSSPSLVIVGDVVNLHQQFNWFGNNNAIGSIFKDLE